MLAGVVLCVMVVQNRMSTPSILHVNIVDMCVRSKKKKTKMVENKLFHVVLSRLIKPEERILSDFLR